MFTMAVSAANPVEAITLSGPTEVNPGATFEVKVVADAMAYTNIEFTVEYDSDLIVANGGVVVGAAAQSINQVNHTGNVIKFACAGATAKTVADGAVLMTITFKTDAAIADATPTSA